MKKITKTIIKKGKIMNTKKLFILSFLYALSLNTSYIQSAQWPAAWMQNISGKDEAACEQAYKESLKLTAEPLASHEVPVTTRLTPISADTQGLIWSKADKEGKKYVLMTSWAQESVVLDEIKGRNLNSPVASNYLANQGNWRRLYSSNPVEEVTLVSKPIRLFWVTPTNETFNFVENYNKLPDPKLPLWMRMSQLLGLTNDQSDNAKKRVFVEMWVRPEDLIRPCVDGSISINGCTMREYQGWSAAEFKKLEAPKDKNPITHLEWYAKQKGNVAGGWPFTGLGYTYDWGNPNDHVRKNLVSHQGASEYMIEAGREVYLHRIVPGFQYGNAAYNFGAKLITQENASKIEPNKQAGHEKEIMPLTD